MDDPSGSVHLLISKIVSKGFNLDVMDRITNNREAINESVSLGLIKNVYNFERVYNFKH